MPNEPENFTRTEIRAGILVLSSAATFVIFLLAIVGFRPGQEMKTFYAHFTDTGGINLGAEVRYGGVEVGRVLDIAPDQERHSRIRATLRIAANIPVNAASTAYVSQKNLTSDKHIEITTGTDTAALLDDGAEIPTGMGGLFGNLEELAGEAVSLLADVKEVFGDTASVDEESVGEEAARSIVGLFTQVGDLLDDARILLGRHDAEGEPTMTSEQERTMAQVLANLDQTIDTGKNLLRNADDIIEENRDEINEMVDGMIALEEDAGKLLGELDSIIEENRPIIETALQDAQEMVAKVSDTADDLIDRLTSLVTSMEGTLENVDILSQDARYLLENNEESIENIIADAREMMRNLKTLVRTLSEQPQSLLRGLTPSGREY